MRKKFLLAIIILLAISLTGCWRIGAAKIERERINYNNAIQRTNDEQLLLNLVRLKYRDTPFFMEVTNVSSQLIFTASAQANATVPDKGFNVFGFGANTSVQEKPTIVYSPLQGDKFIKRFLSPLSLDTISLLFNSGWSIKRLLHLCVQRMDGIRNAPSSSGPTPERVPVFKDFAKLANLFRDLQIIDSIKIDYEIFQDQPRIVLYFRKDQLASEEVKRIVDLLRLTPGKSSYPITTSHTVISPDYVNIETRSLLGIMFYLSQGVEVPPEDIKAGKVTITRHPGGEPFDWHEVTGDILNVKSGNHSPAQSAVAVKYRGHWFYIDDSDLNSKSTFSLLSQIFSLQAGKIKSNAPILTLPIGQ